MADAEAAEDSSLPWKPLAESATWSKSSSNLNTKCLVCFFNVLLFL